MQEVLKELSVPAGLFFIQQGFKERLVLGTGMTKDSEDMAPSSLYDRLYMLVDKDPSVRTGRTKKHAALSGKKGRKTKKNK
jgi:hypothetical protein